MQDARQRAILTALGIRQWVPRAIVTTVAPASNSQLWRQLNDEPDEAATVALHVNPLIQKSDSKPVQPETTAVSSRVAAQPDHHQIQSAQAGQAVVESTFQDIEDVELEPAVGTATASIQNFRLQACEINQWIVLVNEADLQNPQLNTLWKNILLAFRKPEVNHFSWPLSEGQRWQRMTGSQAALNGFLFRLGLDKRVGLMSELADEVCPDRIERLPHLSELIEQPLKKRLLWQLLKAQ